jgi:hypothetical protein
MMYNLWKLAACCTPDTTKDEVYIPTLHDEGISIPVLQPQSGKAGKVGLHINGTNYHCGEVCCEQANDPNEMHVLPLITSTPVRNGMRQFHDELLSMAPSPSPGPPVDNRAVLMSPENVAPWPAQFSAPYAQASLPPPVPQIVGLASSASKAAEEREPGSMIVDLMRDGPQWANLGVLVSQNADNADNLNIDHIDEMSLLGDWNTNLPKNKQVWEGDTIIAVNGCTGRELIRQIQESSERGCRVTLHISRSIGNRHPV